MSATILATRRTQKNKNKNILAASTVSYADFKYRIEANSVADVRYGILLILALSSLTVYGLIISG